MIQPIIGIQGSLENFQLAVPLPPTAQPFELVDLPNFGSSLDHVTWTPLAHKVGVTKGLTVAP